MQEEFDASETNGLPIQIIGLNAIGKSTNGSFVDERELPWLQDISDQSVWDTWGIQYRDILILDENNEPKAVFNLTEFNLSEESSYNAVRDQFLELSHSP